VLAALGCALASVLALASAAPAATGQTVIVDGLGTVTLADTFSIFGSGGQIVFSGQSVGPQFTLTAPTVITEIGAFLNNCTNTTGNPFDCPPGHPFQVEIRASIDGVPDPAHVLATFTLSSDGHPLVVSYESVDPELTLDAGTYFALFAVQDDEVGLLLQSGFLDGALYVADPVTLGFWEPTVPRSSAGETPAAVRILGRALTPAELLARLYAQVSGLGPGRSLADKITHAEAALAASDLATVRSVLAAFVHELAAQAGKTVTPELAATLTGEANQVVAQLGP
jgi:hypothetical protein